MNRVLSIAGLAGIGDALFLALLPGVRARWWDRWIRALGRGSLAPRALAGAELAFGLWLVLRDGRRGACAESGTTRARD